MTTKEIPKKNIQATNRKAMFYLRFRWLGLPILCVGIALFLTVLSTITQTGDYFLILLGFGCMALGLATFGVNHDTAMALVANSYPETKHLDSALQKEFDEELNWDKAKTLALKAHTKTALFVPFLALLLQSYVFIRLSCQLSSNFSSLCTLWIF